MKINEKVIDELLEGYQGPEQILGENGLLKQLTKAVLERALEAEMSVHLGYDKHAPAGRGSGNSRNGTTAKTLQGEFGEIELRTPRDRNAEFEPKIVGKGQRRFEGFDQKILSLYARGMTTREIQSHLEEIYGVEVSPALVSKVTDAVLEEVRTWQRRPLEKLYPVVFLDALFVKIREGGQVANRAVYVALGINLEGEKDVLGLWVADSEGAKFWLQVLTELQNRGVEDVLFFCVDGAGGLRRCDRSGLSAGDGTAVHRTFSTRESEICRLEAAQGGGGGSQAHLRRGDGSGGRGRARSIRGEVASDVSAGQPPLAPRLGAHPTAVCVSTGGAADPVYDECGGIAALLVAQGDQNAGLVSDPGSGAEAIVSGDRQRLQEVALCHGLAGGAASL